GTAPARPPGTSRSRTPASDDPISGLTSSFASVASFILRNDSANGPHPPPRCAGANASASSVIPRPWSVALKRGFCPGPVPACPGAIRAGSRRAPLRRLAIRPRHVLERVPHRVELEGRGAEQPLLQVLVEERDELEAKSFAKLALVLHEKVRVTRHEVQRLS